MATSVYFNNYSASTINEQTLLEDVIVESIQIMGHDIKYLPREVYDSPDDVLGESPNAKFSRAYTIEAYLANVEGYEGDGDFFSKFGLEIRDTSNFVIAARSFRKYVPSSVVMHDPNGSVQQHRPREGDLIYVPVLGKIFEIKFVEEELLFMSLGKRNPYIYELRCEVFRYSGEDLETGDEEIDDIEHSVAYTIDVSMGLGNGNYWVNEIVYQGANLESSIAQAEVKYWDPNTKKLQLINIRGELTNDASLIGVNSGAVYTINSHDTLADLVDYDDSDNRIIQDEADQFIDLTEINPFGVP